MNRENARAYVNQYCRLRDIQYASFDQYARMHNLTAKELFVLDIIWFAPDGCLQSEICERLSATRQTISAIIKKFLRLGYIKLTESKTDRRNKVIRLTRRGKNYAKDIIVPAANAEIDAMETLADADIAELVRLTALFSDAMAKTFEAARTGIASEHAATQSYPYRACPPGSLPVD